MADRNAATVLRRDIFVSSPYLTYPLDVEILELTDLKICGNAYNAGELPPSFLARFVWQRLYGIQRYVATVQGFHERLGCLRYRHDLAVVLANRSCPLRRLHRWIHTLPD
jgi:phage terminase large subunit-like protein